MKTLFIFLVLSATTIMAVAVHAQSAGTVSAICKTVDDARVARDKHDLNTYGESRLPDGK